MLFPCSGASNVGQVADEAAKNLTVEGRASMFCLAAIGGHIPGMSGSARAADRLIAIDGCALDRAKNTLENAGLKISYHTHLTLDLGLEKTPDMTLDPLSVPQVKEHVDHHLQ